MFDIRKFTESSAIYRSAPNLVIYQDEMPSTSDRAKEMVASGSQSGTLVIADFQTAGRGRGGKSWQAEPGESLLFSLILDPDINPALWYRFSLAVGVAIADALANFSFQKDVNIGLKWPNDVHMNGKKVAGILTEIVADKIIIGIGMNISGQALLKTATSLTDLGLASDLSRETILEKLIQSIFRWSSLCDEQYGIVIAKYEKYCVLEGKRIVMTSAGKQVTGMVTGYNEDGFLIIEEDGATFTYSEGRDITVVDG